MIDTSDKLRRVTLRPYRTGHGPYFVLNMWATGGRDWRGQTTIAYRLAQHDRVGRRVLFEAADFHGSPMDADDSDATVAALLGFLTLRPGDTDREYFDDYTEEQRAFADTHAEALGCYADWRFGER